MNRPRVLIADDHILVAQAFRKALEPAYDVVGIVADGRALVSAALDLKPSLVVCDVSMPVMNGMEAARLVKAQLPGVIFVFVTMDQDPDLAAAAFRLGVRGYLLKNSELEELPRCLDAVRSGRRYLTPLIAGGIIADLLLEAGDLPGVDALTPREREVLQLLAEGRSMVEIAGMLEITPRTVAFHKYRLMDRMNLKSNSDLVQFAIRSKVIQG
jgi:DNA-binding NarL/FixJ family response regulator